MIHTPAPQTVSIWVVDVFTSTILTTGTKLATLAIHKQQIALLHDHQYVPLKSTSHVQFVIDKTAFITLGLLQPEQTTTNAIQYRFNNTILTDTPFRDLVNHLNTPLLHHISHAMQLLRWRADHRFCSRCGTPTHNHAHEYASVCPQCHYHSYPRVQPCVITAIVKNQTQPQLLLALHHRHYQKDNPSQSMYGLIAGFVEAGESLEHAVQRETWEETGLSIRHIRYLDSQPWPYPSNLMLGFVAEYADGDLTPQTSELHDARFFDLDKLPNIPKTGTIARTLIDWVITHYQH